jgi:hypothetical protein
VTGRLGTTPRGHASHRRLRTPGRLDEITCADLVLRGCDEGEQAKADRVSESGEGLGEQLGLVLVKAVGADGGAAGNRIEHRVATRGHEQTVSKIFEEIH